MSVAAGGGADPVISGVSLAQYAAVTAALGQAFPLKAVLAIEGLDGPRWAAADRGWTDQLDKDPALLVRYQAELAAAEDQLARTVEPIDNDAGAWLAFLAALGRAPNPDEMLSQHGIGPDDVARLRRRWDARTRQDPALAQRLSDLQRQELGPLPRLRVVKGKLTRVGARVPLVPAAPAASAASTATPATPPLPPPPPVVAAAPPAPPPPPPIQQAPAITNEETAPPLPARRSSDEDGTLVSFDVLATTLPFQDTPSRAFLDAMERPAAAPGEGSDGATVALRGAAALRALDMYQEEPAELNETVAIVSPFTGAPLPFGPSPADEEPPPRSAPAPEHTVMMALPARPAPLSREDATQIMALPRSRDVPPSRKPPDVPHRRTLTGLAAPPPPRPPVAMPMEEPPLSLERHASLCLELALDPTHAADVLARYQVSAALKQHADEFYRARLAADPELRAQWNRAFEIYREWFTSQQRP